MSTNNTTNRIFQFVSFTSQVVVIVSAIGGVAAWASGFLAERLGAMVAAYVEEIHDANPQIEIVRTRIVVHTADLPGSTWPDLPTYKASNVPQPEQQYILDIACPSGYEPAAAWHETAGSHPSIDAMYTVDFKVKEGGGISLTLRARKGRSNSYAYVDVLVLCRYSVPL